MKTSIQTILGMALSVTLTCAYASGGAHQLVDGGNPDKLSPAVSAVLPLCASCHGIDGISAVGLYPNLAGQKVEYLVKQLQAFKSKERNDTVMNAMAEPLSQDAMRELANYFAGRKERAPTN